MPGGGAQKGRGVNFCTCCSLDFASVAAFDAHRIGKFPQRGPAEYWERVSRGLVDPLDDWRPEYGRRCLDADEMLALGWTEDGQGRWIHRSGQASRMRVRAWYSAQAATGARKGTLAYPHVKKAEEASGSRSNECRPRKAA